VGCSGRKRHNLSIKPFLGKRNLVEMVFSVVKRRSGGYFRGILLINQKKEIKLKCIAFLLIVF
jgi:hypothetical protein